MIFKKSENCWKINLLIIIGIGQTGSEIYFGIYIYIYMLHMMGVNAEKSALMLGDSKSVIMNTKMPSSVLKKKHCAINYHWESEMIACQVLKFSLIDSTRTYTDILKKNSINWVI